MSVRAVELSNSRSGRPAFVPVMQPAHFRDRDDAAFVGELYIAWVRRILLQREMRAGSMIIVNERLKVPPQTALVEYEQVVEAFANELCQ